MQNKRFDSFILKAKSVHGDRYDYSHSCYINTSTKIKIICPVHGEFMQSPNNHIYSGGCNKCGYDQCSKKTRLSTDEFILKAKAVHGDRYEYSKVNYQSALSKVIITCKYHGDFEVEANSHIKGKNCRLCSIADQGIAKRSTTDKFISKSKKIHGDRYCYDSTKYTRSSDKLEIFCRIHGNFLQSANDHLDGCGCPLCHGNGYNPTIDGNLYLLISECGKHIKVGISNNVFGRVKALSSATPFKFRLAEFINGNGMLIKQSEKAMHGILSGSGFRGFDGSTEWFNFDPLIFDHFRKIREVFAS